MKNKLNYLVDVSLMRKIKTKWFIIANVLMALAIIAVINIDSVIKLFGGDFNEKINVCVIDETNMSFDILKSQIETLEISLLDEEENYIITKYDKDIESAKEELKEDDNKVLIKIAPDEKTTIKTSLISESYIDTIDYQVFYQAIQNTKTAIAMTNSSISAEELNQIYAPIEIERVILDETKKSESENMDTIMSTVFPIIILPVFMLTLFLVQMIGAEINDEKTTRGMEIIISNVSPKVHFFSKVIAGNVFIIMQGMLLLIYGGLGLFVRKILGTGNIMNSLGGNMTGMVEGIMQTEFISKLIYIIPLTLILMILTFLAYSLLAGILASMTTNAEDFSQLQTPIMLISLAGYYLAMMAGMFKGALFIRILSYVPFISAILSPSLLVLGQIGIIDVIISIILAIIANYLLIKYGLRIYKVGILNYSSKDLWKKMFKAMHEK